MQVDYYKNIMVMRKINDPNLYTNILFLFNSIFYLQISEYICSMSLFLSFFCSSLYHLYSEKNEFWKSCDIITATNSLCITVFFSIQYMNSIHFINLCILGSFCFITKKLSNNTYEFHWVWHIFVFLGQSYICHMMM